MIAAAGFKDWGSVGVGFDRELTQAFQRRSFLTRGADQQ